MSEEEAKQAEKLLSPKFAARAQAITSGAGEAQEALAQKVASLKKSLEEKKEEIAKYKALAEEKKGGIEEIE